jgi:sporulation protein YlmC with PRC-barrel domain
MTPNLIATRCRGKEISMEYVEPNIFKLSESDYQLEESRQDIRGFDVYDINGEQIGSVDDFYIDREAHVTRFLDVSAGGFLKIGKKHFLIPVEEFTRDLSEEDRVRVNHDRDKVLDSPEFDPNEVPDLAFQRTIYDYYGRPIPEDSSTTKITREEVAAKEEHGDVEEVEKSGEEGGRGVIASVVQKAGKGAAKGAVKGAAKELWK